MEKSKNRVALESMLEQQKTLGCKRRDLCLVLFARGYSEKSVGLLLNIDPRSAHAAKIDFSAAGKAKAEKTGKKRIHLDFTKAQLKRVNGKKMLTAFLSLAEKVLAEEENTNA